MQETKGLTPEDMGIDKDQPLPTGNEEVGNAFKRFVSEKISSPDAKVEIEDEGKLFFAGSVDYSEIPVKAYFREYAGSYLNEKSEINFSVVARAEISDDQVKLSKHGRPTPLGEPISQIGIWDEQEKIHIDKGEEAYSISYWLESVKGEEDKRAVVSYDENGKFRGLILTVEQESQNLSKFIQNDGELEFENHQLQSKPDSKKGTYEVTVYEGKTPLYSLKLPQRIDTRYIMGELEIEQLWNNPLQPSEGVSGESNGDTWRFKNFSALTGISMTPIDRRDSLSGPK